MEPFIFRSRLSSIELTTLKARTARQLLHGVQRAPLGSIYYHTHHYLEQHRFLSPEPANDFAFWARHALGDEVLGEALASIDIVQFSSLADLQRALAVVIRAYLQQAGGSRRVSYPGQDFRFMSARSFIITTGLEARDLTEFLDALNQVTVHSLYYHMFEARLRLGRPANDFSTWFETSLERPALAAAVARLDPYTFTMEGLRQRVAAMVRQELGGGHHHG